MVIAATRADDVRSHAVAIGGAIAVPDATSSAFFFDVDGTLIELMAFPGDVVADAGLRHRLASVAAASSGATALISGRRLADLDRIFAPLVLPAAGLHGGEVRFPDGSGRGVPSSWMDHARPAVGAFVDDNPGLWLEDKGGTLAVHFRQRPELAANVLSFMGSFAPTDDIAVQEGKFVAELKPAQFDKGRAIAAFMARPPFHGRRPVFYGDDLTDEAGFAYVNSVGGRSIRIGTDDFPTNAREHLPDPKAMRAHLSVMTGAA